MFDLMLHVLSQFIYRLVVPVDDAIDVRSFDTCVEASERSGPDPSPDCIRPLRQAQGRIG